MSKIKFQIGEQVFTVFQNRLQKLEVVEVVTEDKKHCGTRTYYRLSGEFESECWRQSDSVFETVEEYVEYVYGLFK